MKKKSLFYCTLFLALSAIILSFTYSNSQSTIPPTPYLQQSGNDDDTSIVGIANIIENKDGSVSFNFYEYQSIFTLAKDDKNLALFVRIAKVAKEKNNPVKIIFTNADKISSLVEPTTKEISAYIEKRRLDLKDADHTVAVDIEKIDTSRFNLVEYQKWKAFRLCTKVIPSYADAVTIFNFCAAQQCTFGPTQITPCIPFQYVKDGCFARAHKMRYIIESKYKYCSEKVYSFSQLLDVKASKWGGCCVSWWYHVAPLVRINTKRGVICYVIDPGMFDKPVTLSVWLGAQQNPDCATGDGTTSYSIQPSTTYTPSYNADHNVTATYATDPNYTQTNLDLIYYNTRGATCPN